MVVTVVLFSRAVSIVAFEVRTHNVIDPIILTLVDNGPTTPLNQAREGFSDMVLANEIYDPGNKILEKTCLKMSIDRLIPSSLGPEVESTYVILQVTGLSLSSTTRSKSKELTPNSAVVKPMC